MRRSEVRRWLLFHFTLMAVVLVLAGGKFIGSHLLTATAVQRFEAGGDRTVDLEPLRQTNIYEHYKVFLNSGDLLYQRSRFGAAEEEFRRALALAEGSAACRVRFNLVLTIEQQAKAMIGQRAVLGGVRRLQEAIAMMDKAPECFRSSGDGKDGVADRYRTQRGALRAQIEQVEQAQPVKPQEDTAANASPPDPTDLDRIEADQAQAGRVAQDRKDAREEDTLPPYEGPNW